MWGRWSACVLISGCSVVPTFEPTPAAPPARPAPTLRPVVPAPEASPVDVGPQLHVLEHSVVALDPDGQHIWQATEHGIEQLALPDLQRTTLIADPHHAFLRALAVSPDGTRLVGADHLRGISVWMTERGSLWTNLELPHDDVQEVSFLDNATLSVRGLSKSRSCRGSKAHGSWALQVGLPGAAHVSGSPQVPFVRTPEGIFLVTPGWGPMEDRTRLLAWDRETIGPVVVEVSSDADTVLARGSQRNRRPVRVWTDVLDRAPQVEPAASGALALNPDGHRLATAHGDQVRLLDLPTGRARWLVTPDRSSPLVSWSPDGQELAVVGTHGWGEPAYVAWIYDRDGELLDTFDVGWLDADLLAIAWHPEGGLATVFRPVEGTDAHVLAVGGPAGVRGGFAPGANGQPKWLEQPQVVWSEDGARVGARLRKHRATLLDGHRLQVLHETPVKDVSAPISVTPDGQALLVAEGHTRRSLSIAAGGRFAWTHRGDVLLWDATQGTIPLSVQR